MAKKKGLTSDKLLEQEVDSTIPQPTDVELKALYAVQREQLGKPFEEVKVQLLSTLRNARIRQARQEYSDPFTQLRLRVEWMFTGDGQGLAKTVQNAGVTLLTVRNRRITNLIAKAALSSLQFGGPLCLSELASTV
jgi:hypothetical protein